MRKIPGCVWRKVACGDSLLVVEESPSLSGLAGFFRKYVPVFLAGKNGYRTQNFKRGVKNCRDTSCALELYRL